MSQNDRAIVVGIQTYPGMTDLAGPCHDAQRVRDWLIASDGGDLDPNNVAISLTTDYPAPHGIVTARPVLDDLQDLFRPLVQKAALHQHTQGRLFIYVAGHGFGDAQTIDAAALFVANAELLFPLHLAVTSYAEWFRRNWAFEEIIVIMDCCRTSNPLQAISAPALPRTSSHPNANRVKMFYAFATGWGQLARERAVGGVTSGIFTDALLDALEMAQPNRLGRVTGSIVRNYVHNVIDHIAGEVAIDPPDIEVDDRREVLFTERKGTDGLPVSFIADAGHVGMDLLIRDGQLSEIHRGAIPAAEFTIPLIPGFYKAILPGADIERLFEVPRNEAILI